MRIWASALANGSIHTYTYAYIYAYMYVNASKIVHKHFATAAHTYIHACTQANFCIGAHLIEAIIENDKFEIYFAIANNTNTHMLACIYASACTNKCICVCLCVCKGSCA